MAGGEGRHEQVARGPRLTPRQNLALSPLSLRPGWNHRGGGSELGTCPRLLPAPLGLAV